MDTSNERLSTRIEIAFARGVMIVMAIGIVLTGATLLTTPYAIPLTVTLWLGAAAILGLGVWGELPHDILTDAVRWTNEHSRLGGD